MGQEAGKIQFVVQRAGVSYMMGGLQVGAENKLTALAQGFLHMEAKGFHEVVLVIQNRQVVLANQFFFAAKCAGRENAGDRYLVKVRLNETAFAICLLIGETVHNGLREMAGIDTNAPILVTLAINKVGLIAVRDQVKILDLVSPHAVVLNANHVSVLPG